MQNKNKNVPWGSKVYVSPTIFSSSGEVQLNGNFNAFAYPGNSHFSTISLSVDISYNKFTIFSIDISLLKEIIIISWRHYFVK